MSGGRCNLANPAHSHLTCSLRAGHSGGHRTAGAEWPRHPRLPSPWRPIAAREIAVGQRVSVRGITDRQSAIVDVDEVQVAPDHVVVHGRQPWGGRVRHITRVLHPEGLAELYVEPVGDPA